MALSDRKEQLLFAIVRSYISSGEPVGSKKLLENESLNLSSATIRNEMSELCDMGYLEKPHTSAGRVPTTLGYRSYINHLRQYATISEQERRLIENLLPDDITQAERLINIACEALAELTDSTTILSLPEERDARVAKVEVIALGTRTVMVVVVTTTGTVKNRVVRLDCVVSGDLLDKIHALFDKELCSKSLNEITAPLCQSLVIALGDKGLSAAPVLGAVLDIVSEITDSGVKLWGESKLLTNRQFSAHQATRMIDYLKMQGLKNLKISEELPFSVFLGSETNDDILSSSGMIITTYNQGNKKGTIGILGPDRMDYAKIIPYILYFSESLGRRLMGSCDDEF